MNLLTILQLTSLIAFAALATPLPGDNIYDSVKYPPGTGENLPYYPAPKGGWENVKYSDGVDKDVKYPEQKGDDKDPKHDENGKYDKVFYFTSTYNIIALGSQVRNGTVSAPGPQDAVGYFNYGINSHSDTICYNITLLNVAGTYQSPARTATHIHEGARGASGPPRLAFPNPVGDDKLRVSVGCLTGPFTTGILANGVDTGAGFGIKMIEDRPEGFFTDVHTNLFPLGVVRGQLA